MSKVNINSEVNDLKTVIVHTPGKELENLIPDYLEDLLFDDIPWLNKALKEHDYFKNALKENDVEVVELVDLVSQSLYSEEIKREFINCFLNESHIVNIDKKEIITNYLLELTTKEMIKKTIEGIKKNDIASFSKTSLTDHLSSYPFVTNPMPNLYFARDPFTHVYNHVVISKMHKEARRRETLYGHFIYTYHPQYKNTKRLYNRDDLASIEGGDILVLNKTTVCVGISERTEPQAIEILAKRLFEKTTCNKVLAIDIPKLREFMHLDTVLTQVDHGKFVVHGDFIKEMDCYIIAKESSSYTITKEVSTLERLFTKHLQTKITMIPCGGNDYISAAREQWNDGANTLAIKPGVVIVYERNVITNKLLKDQGIKTIQIPASEISRGRGGPRCMSMPLIRKDA